MKTAIFGRNGLVGSAVERILKANLFSDIIGEPHWVRDLTDQHQVEEFFRNNLPDYVVLAAAKVGGIYANSTYSADFIYSNLEIQNNIIDASYRYRVKRLIFLGSSCIYPRECPQPIKEEYLLSGSLEETNKAYAVAKIAGITMCRSYNKQYGTNFISVMPCNLYGEGDNYDPMNSHVLPALIHKLHIAKTNNEPILTLWGTGTPLREFLYSDDLALAILILLKAENPSDLINIGSGDEISIRDLAMLIKDVVGYSGEIKFDSIMPDGTPRKVLDSSIIRMYGWAPTVCLLDGLEKEYENYLKQDHEISNNNS